MLEVEVSYREELSITFPVQRTDVDEQGGRNLFKTRRLWGIEKQCQATLHETQNNRRMGVSSQIAMWAAPMVGKSVGKRQLPQTTPLKYHFSADTSTTFFI